MLSVIYYPIVFLALYPLYLIYVYFSNLLQAKRMNFPYVSVPLLVQNHPVWMVSGPMTRLWLKARLPTFLFNRIALSIYGYEFFEAREPFTNYVEPQHRADPNLIGSGKSYALVTSGRFEFHTWDAEIAREVAARPKDFCQFDIGNWVMGILGQNVLTTDGSEWARHRRIVAGAVTERVSSVVWNESIRQTRDFLTSITESSNDGSTKTESATTYRMFDLVKRIAVHVLYAAGMGNKIDFTLSENDITDPDDSDKKAGDTVKPSMHLSYIDAVKIINENIAGPNIIPNVILLNWPSWLPGAAWLRNVAYAKIEFPIHTRAALARERQIAAKTGERNNVMSALIAASERNEGATDAEKKSATKKGPALSDEEVVANLYIFTAAGFDTTTNTLAYALVLLCRHPKWQDWIIEEIDSLVPHVSNLNKLEYTEIFPNAPRLLSIMLETLRLFPAIIHLAKMTQAPQTITTASSGTFTIPAYTTIYINNVLLHSDPAVWRNLNMSDVERKAAADDEDDVDGDELAFRPARWLVPNSNEQKIWTPPKGTYLPWSAGPRVCPGQRMAQVEFVAVMFTLFSRHRLEPVRKQTTVQNSGLKAGVEGLGTMSEKKEVLVPESDQALNERLEALMASSQPKLTLEMDVYDIKEDGSDRGLGLRWVRRR
ncbi:hypothetical protein H2198_004597 [Neophaeococcomyces mojaviensis]|uniref:Uncharacterized protein n=1 Tax=Neophaeococcomyces mojaviensis TaxID=3383035 RepID=A0ACC3A819_9EURO|nr:hypothetical protein H2198_004597 [Knufia sp. JES_112]